MHQKQNWLFNQFLSFLAFHKLLHTSITKWITQFLQSFEEKHFFHFAWLLFLKSKWRQCQVGKKVGKYLEKRRENSQGTQKRILTANVSECIRVLQQGSNIWLNLPWFEVYTAVIMLSHSFARLFVDFCCCCFDLILSLPLSPYLIFELIFGAKCKLLSVSFLFCI